MPSKLAFRQALHFSNTHNNALRYELRLAQSMADLDPSRQRPTDFDSFCATREDVGSPTTRNSEMDGSLSSLAPSPPRSPAFPSDDLSPVEALPPGSLMPLLPNHNFVGRQRELKSLYEKLDTDASISLGQTAAVTGLAGIGKTQLAVEFVYCYGWRFSGGVFWLDMSDPNNIPRQIADCGGPEGMNLPGFETLTHNAQVTAVMREWRESRRRLVVFDNVEQLEVVDRWRPASVGTRVLITTRIDSKDYRWAKRGIQVIPVDVLPRERSLELLCRGCGDTLDDPNERQAADAICALLGDLPLAIHLAGAYLSRYRRAVSLRKYLDELRSQPVLTNQALVDHIRDPSSTKHLQNVAGSFETSYRRLDQDDETDALAARLFHLTSHFAPAPIPQELLISALKMDRDRSVDALKLEEAVNRLCELGLIQVVADGLIPSLSSSLSPRTRGATRQRIVVHRLLRELAYHHRAHGQGVREAAEDVAEAIGSFAYEINQSGLPARLRENVEHLRHAARESDRRGSERAGWLHNSLGYHLRMTADLEGAKEHYNRALTIDKVVYGPDHPKVAIRVNNLGYVFQQQGRLGDAREHYNRALEIGEAVYGPNHPNVARYINNLRYVLQQQGDLEGAKEYYNRALRIFEQYLGSDHPNTRIVHGNLQFLLNSSA